MPVLLCPDHHLLPPDLSALCSQHAPIAARRNRRSCPSLPIAEWCSTCCCCSQHLSATWTSRVHVAIHLKVGNYPWENSSHVRYQKSVMRGRLVSFFSFNQKRKRKEKKKEIPVNRKNQTSPFLLKYIFLWILPQTELFKKTYPKSDCNQSKML